MRERIIDRGDARTTITQTLSSGVTIRLVVPDSAADPVRVYEANMGAWSERQCTPKLAANARRIAANAPRGESDDSDG